MFENRQKDRTTDHAQKKKWRELAGMVGQLWSRRPPVDDRRHEL
jgi:hypothetical protein